MPPYNNYGGIEPRPDYMKIYDTAGPSPIMTGEQFSDISNAYNVSNTTTEFMARGEDKINSLLNEDNETERRIINIKNNNKKMNNMNNMNNFTNIKQNKYNSSDGDSYGSSYDNFDSLSSNDSQILVVLQQVINKLDSLEYNMKALHHHKSKNMYDIILYIIFGMILSFILCSIFSSKK